MINPMNWCFKLHGLDVDLLDYLLFSVLAKLVTILRLFLLNFAVLEGLVRIVCTGS